MVVLPRQAKHGPSTFIYDLLVGVATNPGRFLPNGDGVETLLDNVMLMLGCNMLTGGSHDGRNTLLVLAGHGGGTISGECTLDFGNQLKEQQRACNLHSTLSRQIGMKLKQFLDRGESRNGARAQSGIGSDSGASQSGRGRNGRNRGAQSGTGSGTGAIGDRQYLWSAERRNRCAQSGARNRGQAA